jgi:hypothetical protein
MSGPPALSLSRSRLPAAFTAGFDISPPTTGPSKAAFDMNLWYAKKAVYTDNITDFGAFKGGWDGGGAIPGFWPYPGLGCGQGYLWTLM